MNYQIEFFYANLIELINGCGLPLGAARFVLRDCLNQIEIGYREAIQKEREEKEKVEKVSLCESASDKNKEEGEKE